MLKTKIICDGCDHSVELAPDQDTDEIKIGCLVSIGGGADSKFDLCQSCQRRLTESANPKAWPRDAKARAA